MNPIQTNTRMEALEQNLLRLDKKYNKLRRLNYSLFIGLFILVVLVVMGFTSKHNTIRADEILKVRGLVVVDGNGTERVWIGAPVPDPPVVGKRINRDGTASGILLFDAEGNERSGYVTFDETNSVVFTLDEVGRMVANFSAGPAGGVKLLLTDEYDNNLTMGTYQGGPYLRMFKRDPLQNKVLFLQPDSTNKKN